MPKPGILVGVLCGALVTAALIASLFFAHALAGLPFVPFQLFDRAARTLPGAMIRFGIDTMVWVIRGLQIGETSSVAKTAEQAMAVVGCLLVGTLAGALLFAIWRPQAGRWPGQGVVVGLLLGVPAAWVAAIAEEPFQRRTGAGRGVGTPGVPGVGPHARLDSEPARDPGHHSGRPRGGRGVADRSPTLSGSCGRGDGHDHGRRRGPRHAASYERETFEPETVCFSRSCTSSTSSAFKRGCPEP
jgi:hypothetical protein